MKAPDIKDSQWRQVAELVAEGKPIKHSLREVGISRWTYDKHLRENDEFRELMERACSYGFDAIADECMEIADTAEDASKGKLQVWTRLQLLAKWHPRKYGEKQQLEHSGPDGGPIPVAKLSDAELDAQIRSILDKNPKLKEQFK